MAQCEAEFNYSVFASYGCCYSCPSIAHVSVEVISAIFTISTIFASNRICVSIGRRPALTSQGDVLANKQFWITRDQHHSPLLGVGWVVGVGGGHSGPKSRYTVP